MSDFPIEAPLAVEEESGWHEEMSDGSRKALPRLRLLAGSGPRRRLVDDVIDSFSFLVDRPLNIRAEGRSKLVPENQTDAELLAEVGSDEPYAATGAQLSIRTASLEVGAENVEALMNGPRVGVRLYADALRLSLETSRFREMWKVLESAFNSKEKVLVQKLAAYKPARQMRFDEAELEHLRHLRGRASHAETRTPDKELSRVERECTKLLPRLQCLAERVILTKKSWGARSGGVSNGAPSLMSYVGRDGRVVLIQKSRGAQKEAS